MIEMNKVLLMARLTRDPEMRFLPSGMGVCKMRVAADRSFSDKGSGERKSETLFIDVTAWGKTAEFCNEYFRKGSAIFVEGRLKSDSWKDKEGNNRETIGVVADRVSFGETKAEAQNRQGRSGGASGDYDAMDHNEGPSSSAPMGGGGGGGQTTDDLPF